MARSGKDKVVETLRSITWRRFQRRGTFDETGNYGGVSLTGRILSGTLLVILFRAAFTDGIHFEMTVSRPLAVGLLVLLIVANTYFVTTHFEVRRPREHIISTTLQNRLVEQRSFTDPLTEVYDRRSLEDRRPIYEPCSHTKSSAGVPDH